MAGGSGTRLWPISRDYYPKQFLKLYGDQTLIQQTFIRLKKNIDPKYIYITTNRIFVDEIIRQLKKYGFKKNNIIIQSTDKNTGPTLAYAAKKIFEKDRLATIINCPSDHLISSQDKFTSSVKAGYKLAQEGLLVTFGVKPTFPNPEYGYIKPHKQTYKKINSYKVFKVGRFIEKPNSNKASALIKSGSLWNSGIFIWRAEIILNEINKLAPDIYEALDSTQNYLMLNSSSIDNSILEKSNLVWVIPAGFRKWRDIGSWKALYDLLPKDGQQNVLNSRVVSLNSSNSLIYGVEGRVVTAINVKDLIIVDTHDSVLISHKENVHEVKLALQKLEENKLTKKLQRPLLTIIIPTLNDQKFLEKTLISIFNQDYKNIEYIIVDGGSIDMTPKIINKYRHKIDQSIILQKAKYFEKINQGLKLANGEIIGILQPGDSYIDNKVIDEVIENMEKNGSDVTWGDMVYVSNDNTDKVAMYWKSSKYKKGLLQQGWIPPHPTFFVRRHLYKKYGYFNVKFNIAAEYDLMLRFLEKYNVKSNYIPKILVKMTGKGVSFKNILDRLIGNLEAYKSWQENDLKISPLILLSKNLSRISQIWKKKDLRLHIQN